MVTVADITSVLNDDGKNWAHQTVGTFLKRLEAKVMVSSSKSGKNLYYFPLMSKEQFKTKEASGFVKDKFEGSSDILPPLSVSVGGGSMSLDLHLVL